jgi:regulator of sirC expression with transglutaminase-like and TPR domain
MRLENAQQLWDPSDDDAIRRCSAAIARSDLAEALLAVEGSSPEAADACLARMTSWAERARRHLGSATADGQVRALATVLIGEEQLAGDTADYYNPVNSRLTAVVERRRGLPILLSSVWMMVGERAGLAVDGIALPGHFIVRVGGEDRRLVDPFGGGRLLTREDCRDIVRQLSDGTLPWTDAFLRPTSVAALVQRVLRNLINAGRATSDATAQYRPARILAALCPDVAEVRMTEAQVTEQLGALRLATRLYEDVARDFPGTPLAKEAGARIPALRERLARVN